MTCDQVRLSPLGRVYIVVHSLVKRHKTDRWDSRAIVDPERRQWKWWNYVTFWIADSLNIVSFFPSRE